VKEEELKKCDFEDFNFFKIPFLNYLQNGFLVDANKKFWVAVKVK